MKEHPNYRQELEEVLRTFGDRHFISYKEIQQYTGRSRTWCNNHLPVPTTGCTAVELAKAMCNIK